MVSYRWEGLRMAGPGHPRSSRGNYPVHSGVWRWEHDVVGCHPVRGIFGVGLVRRSSKVVEQQRLTLGVAYMFSLSSFLIGLSSDITLPALAKENATATTTASYALLQLTLQRDERSTSYDNASSECLLFVSKQATRC